MKQSIKLTKVYLRQLSISPKKTTTHEILKFRYDMKTYEINIDKMYLTTLTNILLFSFSNIVYENQTYAWLAFCQHLEKLIVLIN